MQHGLTATGTHMPCGITECYLPPGRGKISALTPAEDSTRFCDLGATQRCVATAVKVYSPCPRLYTAVVVVINTTVRGSFHTAVRRANHYSHCDLLYCRVRGIMRKNFANYAQRF